jgi:23S rRNA pseudouridine1911/1915/1917 synthase
VMGDPVYGGSRRSREPAPRRQLLHARTLAFAHPVTGEPVRVESPVPADFTEALDALRRSARRSEAPKPAKRSSRSSTR